MEREIKERILSRDPLHPYIPPPPPQLVPRIQGKRVRIAMQ